MARAASVRRDRSYLRTGAEPSAPEVAVGQMKDFFLGGEGRLVAGNAAVALIVVDREHYLLQLRDQKPGIFYPGHWGLFGGATEPGEPPEAAGAREIKEELGRGVPHINRL